MSNAIELLPGCYQPLWEYKGQRVVTFKGIDAAHECTAGTARTQGQSCNDLAALLRASRVQVYRWTTGRSIPQRAWTDRIISTLATDDAHIIE